MGLPAPPSFDEFQASASTKAATAEVSPPEPENKNYGDPNRWLQNPPSVFVQIQDVSSREELNGQLGLVVGYQYDVGNTNGRYVIFLAVAKRRASFRPEKLRKASWALSLIGRIQILRYNPELQEWFRKAGASPVVAVVAVGALLLHIVLLFYFYGFAKTMTLLSLGMLAAWVVGPDLIQGKSAAQLRQNIPYNVRNLVQELFGDRIAASPAMTWSIVGLWGVYAIWTLVGR